MIKVLIVDDQELIRESLQMLIDSDDRFTVIGTAENGLEAVREVYENRPDVVLMDIRMPELDGTRSVKMIKEHDSGIRVIMLTTFENDEYIYHSLKNGADGFLLKGISKKDLLNSIETVFSGGASFDPKTTNKVLTIFNRMAQSYFLEESHDDEIDKLSITELQIIQAIGRGLSNKEIMGEIHLSEGTVRNYISTILKKLNLRDRTQIAIFAIQYGLMLKTFEAPK